MHLAAKVGNGNAYAAMTKSSLMGENGLIALGCVAAGVLIAAMLDSVGGW